MSVHPFPKARIAAFFDLDGTLFCGTEPVIKASKLCVLDEHGLEISGAEYDDHFLGKGTQAGYESLLASRAADPFNAAAMAAREIEVKRELLRDSETVKLVAGAMELLEHLKQNGVYLGALTNEDAPVQEVKDRLFSDLMAMFDDRRNACDIRGLGLRVKPSCDGLRVMMAHSELPPESCFMIGDTTNDIIAGCSAGLVCIGTVASIYDEAERQKAETALWQSGAHQVVSDLRDIASHILPDIPMLQETPRVARGMRL